MGAAYEKATSGCADDATRALIAKRIIEATQRGERDIARLSAYALKGLDGIADAG
jgi:hypothetical protein